MNGIPLGLIELKVPGKERATMRGAFDQLRTYAAQIPALLTFNACCVVSTGTQARIGPLPERFEHFAPWKTIDGTGLAPAGVPGDAGAHSGGVRQDSVPGPRPQLHHVLGRARRAGEAPGEVPPVPRREQGGRARRSAAIRRGDGRAGVVWHTQGSGKSLEMLFYAAKLMVHPAMANPTVVVLTDRNDLDDQLFDEVFAPARTLPETPVQAESRDHLRKLLADRPSGGIVFSTMQKFGRTKTGAGRQPDVPVAIGASQHRGDRR